MSVPNQKIIKINQIKRNSDNKYAMMNLDALQLAMNDLKECGLKMWLYFNKNQNNHGFELSMKACEAWGIKKNSYYRGVEELIEKHYLVPTKEGSNIYNFYEAP